MPTTKTRKKTSKPRKIRSGAYSAIPRKLKFIIAAAVILVVATIGYLQIKSSFAYTPATILYFDFKSDGSTSLNVRDGLGTAETLVPDASVSSAFGGASLTPDGSKALYQGEDDQILVVDRQSRDTRPLTNAVEVEESPRVSPDGIWVTYIHYPYGSDSRFVLSMIKIDGTGQRLVTQPGEIAGSAADWSPDGRRLAYTTIDPDGVISKLWNINADGTDRKLVDTGTGNLHGPEWSPDGKFLFYSKAGRIHASNLTGKIVDTGVSHRSRFAVSNDWNMYFTMFSGGYPDPSNSNDGIRRMWLGDFTTHAKESMPSPVTVLGDVLPSGTVLPPPDGFLAKFGMTAANLCPPALFVGAMASGEHDPLYKAGGLGTTVRTAANAFAIQYPTAEVQPVPYRAVSIRWYDPANYGHEYANSVLEGEGAMRRIVKEFVDRCPTKPVVMAGYSQGAQVAGNVYQSLKGKYLKNVAGLVMFGDPRFKGMQTYGVNQGTYTAQLNGVMSTLFRPFNEKPRSFNNKDAGNFVRSYCAFMDPVCNAPQLTSLCPVFTREVSEATGCPHAKYIDYGWADKGGVWLSDRAKAWKP